MIRLLIVLFVFTTSNITPVRSMFSKPVSEEESGKTFILFTNDNYIVPTIVALHSFLMHNIYPKHIIVFLKSDNYLHSIKLISKLVATFHDQSFLTLVNVNSSYVSTKIKDITFARQQGNDAQRIKVVLPQILPIVLKGLNPKLQACDYIWLDSDILVMESIDNLYQVCRDSQSPIASANLRFFKPDFPRDITDIDSVKKGLSGGVGNITAQQQDNDLIPTENILPSWRTSGGVMYFNLKNILKKGVFTSPIDASTFQDDEVFWDHLIFSSSSRKHNHTTKIFAFSPKYNFAPSKLWQAQSLVNCIESSKTDKTDLEEHYKSFGFADSLEALREIVKKEVVIWHWDAIPKPWEKALGDWTEFNPKNIAGFDVYEADKLWLQELNDVEVQVGITISRIINQADGTIAFNISPVDCDLEFKNWSKVTVNGSSINKQTSFSDEWIVTTFFPHVNIKMKKS